MWKEKKNSTIYIAYIKTEKEERERESWILDQTITLPRKGEPARAQY